MQRTLIYSALFAVAMLGHVPNASADTLLIERTTVPLAAPSRGMTAHQVQSRHGDPLEKLSPRGGQKRQWPTINRWVYPEFTVYFEHSRVIDVVANRASSGEIGPKPPTH